MEAGVGITRNYKDGLYTGYKEIEGISVDASQEAIVHVYVVGDRLLISVLVEDVRVELTLHCSCERGTFWCWWFGNHHVEVGLVFFDSVGSKRKTL